MVLRVPEMPGNFEAERWRLLRVLLIRVGRVPAQANARFVLWLARRCPIDRGDGRLFQWGPAGVGAGTGLPVIYDGTSGPAR